MDGRVNDGRGLTGERVFDFVVYGNVGLLSLLMCGGILYHRVRKTRIAVFHPMSSRSVAMGLDVVKVAV